MLDTLFSLIFLVKAILFFQSWLRHEPGRAQRMRRYAAHNVWPPAKSKKKIYYKFFFNWEKEEAQAQKIFIVNSVYYFLNIFSCFFCSFYVVFLFQN
jgi:hypothetical protein